MSKRLLTQTQALEYLNISQSIILNWERSDGHRRYKTEELNYLIGER